MNNQIYIGSTNNLKRRVTEHNSGKSPSTKRYMPWSLIYFEAYIKENLARLREKRLKYHGNAIKELKKRLGSLSTTNEFSHKNHAHQNKSPKDVLNNRVNKFHGAGFTLLEFLIASAITSFLLIVIVGVYLTHFRIFSNQNTSINVATQNKLALDEIVNEIRESAGVVVSCTNPPCSPTETTSETVLVMQVWPLDTGTGDPVDPGVGTNYDYFIYKRDPANTANLIKKTVPCASPCTTKRTSGTDIIASNVSNLTFVYKNNSDLTCPTSCPYTDSTQIATTIVTTAQNFNKTFTTTQSATGQIRNK